MVSIGMLIEFCETAVLLGNTMCVVGIREWAFKLACEFNGYETLPVGLQRKTTKMIPV